MFYKHKFRNNDSMSFERIQLTDIQYLRIEPVHDIFQILAYDIIYIQASDFLSVNGN